jgi:hypothetical protein
MLGFNSHVHITATLTVVLCTLQHFAGACLACHYRDSSNCCPCTSQDIPLLLHAFGGKVMYFVHTAEKASVLLGKVAHYSLLLAVPALLHGLPAALTGAAGYSISLSIVLAVVFFVSHNMPENKPNLTGADETKKVSNTAGLAAVQSSLCLATVYMPQAKVQAEWYVIFAYLYIVTPWLVTSVLLPLLLLLLLLPGAVHAAY